MKDFSVAFFNAQSLLNKFNDVKNFILHEGYDIVGVSETWLKNDLPDNIVKIDGYNFVHKDREGRGGGVGIYLREKFGYEVLERPNVNALEQIW